MRATTTGIKKVITNLKIMTSKNTELKYAMIVIIEHAGSKIEIPQTNAPSQPLKP